MSADARVARAIIEVREQLDQETIRGPLYRAITVLIVEVMDALHMNGADIEGYR